MKIPTGRKPPRKPGDQNATPDPRSPRVLVGLAGPERTPLHNTSGIPLSIIGATGTGKSTICAAIARDALHANVVIVSANSDLLEATISLRERLGLVQIFDPEGVTGHPGAGIDPIAWTNGTLEGAADLARGQVGSGANSGIQESSFWYSLATTLWTVAILGAHLAHKHLDTAYRWIMTEDFDELEGILRHHGEEQALWMLQSITSREERIQSSIIATAQQAAGNLHKPAALAAQIRNEIIPETILGLPRTNTPRPPTPQRGITTPTPTITPGIHDYGYSTTSDTYRMLFGPPEEKRPFTNPPPGNADHAGNSIKNEDWAEDDGWADNDSWADTDWSDYNLPTPAPQQSRPLRPGKGGKRASAGQKSPGRRSSSHPLGPSNNQSDASTLADHSVDHRADDSGEFDDQLAPPTTTYITLPLHMMRNYSHVITLLLNRILDLAREAESSPTPSHGDSSSSSTKRPTPPP